MGIFVLFLLVLMAAAAGGLRLVQAYEKAALYNMGRYAGIKGPGIVYVVPFLQNLVRVDMRKRRTIFSEDLHPSDNLTLKIDVEIFFRVDDPAKAVNNVEDYMAAMATEARRLLHEAAAGMKRDAILSALGTIAAGMRAPLEVKTRSWGVSVSGVALRQSTGNSFGEVHSA